MADAYLRVWVKGGKVADANALLDLMDGRYFAPVEYLGSARLDHELADTPAEDRCHILIGLRGREGAIRTAIGKVKAEPQVDTAHGDGGVQTLWVASILVNK